MRSRDDQLAGHDAHDGTLDLERLQYYTAEWQLIEERINDDLDANGDTDRIAIQVWGTRYIDDAAIRGESTDLTNDGLGLTLEKTRYYATDALFSTVALLDSDGDLLERVRYTPYGEARHWKAADLDGDGDVDDDDKDILWDAWGNSSDIADAAYNADADINRDGQVDAADDGVRLQSVGAALPEGQISEVDNPIGYAGYVFSAADATYLVRNRCYEPDAGRWLERDPLLSSPNLSLPSLADGTIVRVPPSNDAVIRLSRDTLYSYANLGPSGFNDPLGLWCNRPVPDPNFVPSPNSCGPSLIGNVGFYVGALVGTGIGQCCNRHDVCYATCNSSKLGCDLKFFSCMLSACAGNPACEYIATTFLGAVQSPRGDSAYNNAQQAACTCCDPFDMFPWPTHPCSVPPPPECQ